MAISATVNLSLEVGGLQGIALSCDNPAVKTNLGKTASWGIKIESVNGFAGDVAFSVSGLPAGVVAVFSPPRLTVAPGYDLGTILSLDIPNDPALVGTLALVVSADEVPPEE